MAVRCGNCHSEHANTQGVRDCYAKTANAGSVATVATLSGLPATEKQVAFIQSLLASRQMDKDEHDTIDEALKMGVVTKARASEIIELLKAKPQVLQTATRLDVPPGRYAVEVAGEWKFIQVSHGTAGTRWAGYVFLDYLVGAPGHFAKHPLKSPAVRQQMLSAIHDDPKQAAIEFGQRTGECGVCGSPLTNAESVAYGIGPVCRAKTGW